MVGAESRSFELAPSLRRRIDLLGVRDDHALICRLVEATHVRFHYFPKAAVIRRMASDQCHHEWTKVGSISRFVDANVPGHDCASCEYNDADRPGIVARA